jgi:GntR family transcriptional regulator
MAEDDIQRGIDQPVYVQLAAILRRMIESGELAPRYPLPSKTTLKQDYGVADTTASKAVRLLKEEGLVRTVQGLGIFVVPPDERPPADSS